MSFYNGAPYRNILSKNSKIRTPIDISYQLKWSVSALGESLCMQTRYIY